jgi:drug/metabolite transporter (DMT)-like permease
MLVYLLTVLTMLAFAANSVLCRMALVDLGDGPSIDAASFTSIRLLSGALMLALILLLRSHSLRPEGIRPTSVLMLFIYAVCLSFSYIDIATGTGALILFGTVQLTMVTLGLLQGERPGHMAWLGIMLALGGLVYLLLPGVSAPPILNALLMMVSGMAWGVYSILGKGVRNPLATTGWNFIGTIPLVLITAAVFHADASLTTRGIFLAVLSGAVTSGIGYAIWYTALPHLTATSAATVQLTVPVIATIGGLVLISEPVTTRLILATIAVLSGVYLTINSRQDSQEKIKRSWNSWR